MPFFAIGFLPLAMLAADPPLADYFGFDGMDVVRFDKGAGPLIVADMNSDGLNDLVVINNHSSRIEVHQQKPNAKPEDLIFEPSRPNELPEHWRFKRILISVSHRVMAVVPHDFDGDGRMDLIYAGSPPEIVREVSPLSERPWDPLGSPRGRGSTRRRRLHPTCRSTPRTG